MTTPAKKPKTKTAKAARASRTNGRLGGRPARDLEWFYSMIESMRPCPARPVRHGYKYEWALATRRKRLVTYWEVGIQFVEVAPDK
jgi:hypothetical protein